MLYLFTGNSDFLLEQQVKAWKDLFIKKHGDFNLFHIKNILDVDNNILTEGLLSKSFMIGTKQLIIIDNIPIDSKNKNSEIKLKQDFLLNLLDKIPEDNIVVFISLNPDKRSKIYKKLKKEAELKEFNIKGDFDIINILQKKYNSKIDIAAINTIIKYKSNNLNKIINELEKLFITKEFITIKDIKDNITPELEESIFMFLDDLLNLRIKETLRKLDIILENASIYYFYNNLLANIRTQVFIMKLKDIGNNKNQIISSLKLGKRGFLVDKNYYIDNNKLKIFYIDLINLDRKMKSGNMVGTKENDFKFELEKIIISLKK